MIVLLWCYSDLLICRFYSVNFQYFFDIPSYFSEENSRLVWYKSGAQMPSDSWA